ncbi:MAG: glycosyltransferase [Planctomycetota bacterium]
MRARAWVILTGEYPPQRGGVADHTRLLAEGLAARGHEVHVCAPDPEEPAEPTPPERGGVQVHRLPGSFGPRALATLDALLLDELPRPRRLLVQYVPHAFGQRALNLGLCVWLAARGRQETLWTYFHEVAYPYQDPPWRRTNLLAGGHRLMAALVARASARRLVTTPRWAELLAQVADPARYPCEWQGVFSNLPTAADPARVLALRAELGAPGQGEGSARDRVLLGHFGSYGRLIAPALAASAPRALDRAPRAHLVLLGRGSEAFAAALRAEHPRHGQRIHARGALAPAAAAEAISAMDLLLQPYEDGVCSRRGSLQAALALGRCVLTHAGPATEPLWAESGAVALAPGSPDALAAAAAQLCADPQRRAELGARARRVYTERFALERTLERLEGEAPLP